MQTPFDREPDLETRGPLKIWVLMEDEALPLDWVRTIELDNGVTLVFALFEVEEKNGETLTSSKNWRGARGRDQQKYMICLEGISRVECELALPFGQPSHKV